MAKKSPKINHKVKHIYTLQTTVQIMLVLFLITIFLFIRYNTIAAKVITVKKSSTSKTVPVKTQVQPKTVSQKPSSNPIPVAVKTTPAAPSKTTPASTPTNTPVATQTPGTGVHSLSPVPSSPAPSSGTSSTSTSNDPPVNSYTSLNWSGYMSNRGTYSAVSGSWDVPQSTGNSSSESADASWVGIGGVSSNDLIQAGTENTVEPNGKVFSAAFYELLPSSADLVQTMAVSPGDSISVSINTLSSNFWSIGITDNTTGQTFNKEVIYASSESSAEWIEEDPSYTNSSLVPFDNFGIISFINGSTTLNGNVSTISDSSASLIKLVNGSGQTEATPSSLNSDGASFSVNRN
jgi:hypothetical protein